MRRGPAPSPGRVWATDFWHLPNELVEALSDLAEIVEVGPLGEVVLDFGQTEEALYVVKEGIFTAWRRPSAGAISEIFSLPSGVTFGDPGLATLPGMPSCPEHGQSRIVAPPMGAYYRLPYPALSRLLAGLDEEHRLLLLNCFRDMCRVYLATPRIGGQLSEHPLFRGLPRRWMAALLEGAAIHGVGGGRGPRIFEEHERPVLVALEGQAWLRCIDDPPSRSRALWASTSAVIDTGEQRGVLHLSAAERAWVMAIPTELLERAARAELGFRRHALRMSSPKSPRGEGLRRVDDHDVGVVALGCLDPEQRTVRVDHLLEEVAEHARSQFKDRVRTVGLLPRGSTLRGAWQQRVYFSPSGEPLRFEDEGGQLLDPDFPAWESEDLILLDASRVPADRPEVLRRADHVYRLDTDGRKLPTQGDDRIVRVLGTQRHKSQDRQQGDGPLRGDARPSLRALAQPGRPSGLDEASIGRISRAFTYRSVGLALGGGGALGWAHLPVIEALHREGVPIDYVSGTSFGAVVAAFYCAAQEEGLARLKERSGRLFRLALKSMRDSEALGRFIDEELAELGHHDLGLDDLPIAFFPVSTSAKDLAPALPSHCSLSLAVRASGALPPVFSPVRWRTAAGEVTNLLDGAFVANVPAEVLRNAEVALIISSDTIPRPNIQPDSRARIGLLDRIGDAWRGSERAIHDLSSRSARAGEVRFEANMPLAWAINFRKRKRIEHEAGRALEDSHFALRAGQAWRMLSRGPEDSAG